MFRNYSTYIAVLLLLYSLLPLAVSMYYAGNPPPYVAKVLDAQVDTFKAVAPMVMNPFHGAATVLRGETEKK
jgi:hypothetical protein